MIRRISLVLTALTTTASAQWINYRAPGIPRQPDGKPNLSAPAPKGPDGKPDLYGLWELNRELDATRRFDTAEPGMPFDEAAPGITIKPEDIVLTSEEKRCTGSEGKTTSPPPNVCQTPCRGAMALFRSKSLLSADC